MQFTKEELNNIGLLIGGATIKGSDATKVANLLNKISILMSINQEIKEEVKPEVENK